MMVSSVGGCFSHNKVTPTRRIRMVWFASVDATSSHASHTPLHMSSSQHGAIATHANAAAFRRGALALQATTGCREIERICDDARRSWRTRESETGSQNRTSCSDPDRTGLPLKTKPFAAGPFVYLMRRILTGPWVARYPVCECDIEWSSKNYYTPVNGAGFLTLRNSFVSVSRWKPGSAESCQCDCTLVFILGQQSG